MTSRANLSSLRRISTLALVAGIMLAMSAGTGLGAEFNPSTFVDDGNEQHFQGGEWNDANNPNPFDIGTSTVVLDSGYTFYYSGTGGWRAWKPTSGSFATFRNEGTVIYSATGGRGTMYLTYGGGDLFVENAGVWDMTAPSLVNAWYSRKDPGVGRFTNTSTGTFLNSGGGTFSMEKDWAFYNLGGTVKVTNGSTINLGLTTEVSQSTGGTFDSNNGTIRVQGRWSELSGVAVGDTVKMGYLYAGAPVTKINITGLGLELTGSHQWICGSGQTMENTGLITSTSGGLEAKIKDTGTIFLNSGTFVQKVGGLRLGEESGVSYHNAGTHRFEHGGGNYTYGIYGHGNAVFDNLPTGVIETTVSGGNNFYGTGTGQVFRNQGKIVMTGGSSMSLLNAWTTHTSTVDSGVLKEGTWEIGNGSTFSFESGQADIVTLGSGAKVALIGTGSMTQMGASLATVQGTLLISDRDFTNNLAVDGGTIGGDGNFTGTITLSNGGQIAGGLSIGTVNVEDATFQSGGGLEVEIDLAAATNDLVNVTGTLTVDAGTHVVKLVNFGGSALSPAGTYTIMTYADGNDNANATQWSVNNDGTGATTTVTWTDNDTAGDWDDAANWDLSAWVGGVFTDTGSALELSGLSVGASAPLGTSDVTIAPVSPAAALTVAGPASDATIASLDIQSSATLAMGAGKLTVTGDATVGGSLEIGSGETFAAGGDIVVNGSLTATGTGILSVGSSLGGQDLALTGVLQLAGAATSEGPTATVDSNVDLSGGGTLTVTADHVNINASINVNGGTLTDATSTTFNVNSGGDLAVASQAVSVGGLNLNGGTLSTTTLTSLTVSDTLTLTGSNLDASAYTLDPTGATVTLNTGTTLTVGNAISVGTLNLAGGALAGGQDLTVTDPATLTLSGGSDLDMTGATLDVSATSVTVNSGSTLTVDQTTMAVGGALTVGGDVVLNGTTATIAPGDVNPTSGGTITANVAGGTSSGIDLPNGSNLFPNYDGVIDLVFDDEPSGGGGEYWGLRWEGNHGAKLTSMLGGVGSYTGTKITASLTGIGDVNNVRVAYDGSYTYVGFGDLPAWTQGTTLASLTFDANGAGDLGYTMTGGTGGATGVLDQDNYVNQGTDGNFYLIRQPGSEAQLNLDPIDATGYSDLQLTISLGSGYSVYNNDYAYIEVDPNGEGNWVALQEIRGSVGGSDTYEFTPEGIDLSRRIMVDGYVFSLPSSMDDSNNVLIRVRGWNDAAQNSLVFDNFLITGILTVPSFDLGDVNGDGNVDTLDISPFVAAILAVDEAAFLLEYPDGEYWAGDVDDDGNVDTLDITPFVNLLTGGGEVPEPATMALLGLGALGVVVRRRRK